MESSQPPSSRKKEVFQWSTPADEFADDVGSDVEEEVVAEVDIEDEHQTTVAAADAEAEAESESKDHGSESDDDPLRHDLPDEEDMDEDLPPADEDDANETDTFNVDQETGGIIINLGVEEADKFSALENMGKRRRRKGAEGLKPKHKYPCPKCSKEWSWPWELRRHIVTHYREKERQETSAYKCETCGKGFQWKRDLAQHRRLHTGEKLLICSVCQKKFTTRQALLHHVVVHTGEKPFQCAFCGNKFTQPANLRTHMKKKHPEMNCKGNKCPHCGEGFTSIVAVHQHVLDDHQNLVAEARESLELERIKKEAEKIRKEKDKMERRKIRIKEKVLNIANGDRPYKRVKEWEMEYEFQLGEGLVRGVDWDRTPSNGELSCDQCERKFGWRYEVMFHGLCHLVDEEGNAKNKVCPECDTAFKVPIGLKHHLVLHTGETPFLCLHCWKSFASHIDLKLHIRKEHLLHLLPAPGSTKSKKSSSKEGSSSKAGDKDHESAKQIKKEEKGGTSIRFDPLRQGGSMEDSVTVVVEEDDRSVVGASADGQTQETETIVIGGEQISNDQDMIVIVQSGEFEESQGLIVVDPSQIRQINGSRIETDGSSENDGKDTGGQFVKLQVSEGSEETTVVVSQEETAQDEGDESTYVVVDSNNQIHIQSSQSREVPPSEAKVVVENQNRQGPSRNTRSSSATSSSGVIISSDQQLSEVHTETIIADDKKAVLFEKESER